MSEERATGLEIEIASTVFADLQARAVRHRIACGSRSGCAAGDLLGRPAWREAPTHGPWPRFPIWPVTDPLTLFMVFIFRTATVLKCQNQPGAESVS